MRPWAALLAALLVPSFAAQAAPPPGLADPKWFGAEEHLQRESSYRIEVA